MLIDNQFNKVLEPWGTEEGINTISQNIIYKSTHIVLNYLQIAGVLVFVAGRARAVKNFDQNF